MEPVRTLISSSSSDKTRRTQGQPGQELRPITTYTGMMESLCSRLNLQPKDVMPKMGYGVVKAGDTQVQLTTNAFGLVVPPANLVHRYEVKVYGVRNSGNHIQLNLRKKADVTIALQRQDLKAIFEAIAMNPSYANFFKVPDNASPLQVLAFDFSDFLYSKSRLQFNEAPQNVTVKEDQIAFELESGKGGFERFENRFKTVVFCIRDNDDPPLDVKTFESQQVVAGVSKDTSGRIFLQVGTSQNVLHSSEYLTYDTNTAYMMDPVKFGFKNADMPSIGEGKYLGIGAEKVVHMVEGPRKVPSPAVFISCKKTPFYFADEILRLSSYVLGMGEQDFADELSHRRMDLGTVGKLNSAFAGLYVYSKLDEGRIMNMHKVLQIVNVIPAEKKFKLGDDEVNLIDYYSKKFGVKLHFTNAPLAEVSAEYGEPNPNSKSSRASIFYPLEVLRLCDYQRVHHESPDLTSALIKACAVPPSQNYRNIINARNAWGFDKCSMTKSMGITVTQNPLVLNAHKLSCPGIEFSSGSVPVSEMAKWNASRNQYLVPATIDAWGIYYLADRFQRNNIVQEFAQRFIGECRNKGIIINDPVEQDAIEATLPAMDRKFGQACNNGIVFMFFIHDDRERKGHSIMKMLERKYEIITQGLNSRTANNIINKRQNQTLENVVAKTNIKNGGLNYTLKVTPSSFQHILSPTTLYIGFAISKPAGGLTKNSEGLDVIGYSSNTAKRGTRNNPFEFVGDFRIVKGGGENVERLEEIVDIIGHCVKLFTETRGKYPENMIIYRHGCDEGLYKSISKFEVPYIEKKLNEISAGNKIKWALIVPSKMHTASILKKEITDANNPIHNLRPPEQNIAPGTVIDHSLVHPHLAEFYLCSHSALQGTAKVPRYTILHSNIGLSMDDFERLTWNLSFGHQIINFTVSLPAPSYIANRYAERGRMLYNQASNIAVPTEEIYKLSYIKSEYLKEFRVNA